MNNKFFNVLLEIDRGGFEYKVDKEFEAQTGIRGKRFQSILKSGGKDASVSEVKTLLDYYSKKSGLKLEFQDLFGNQDDDNAEEGAVQKNKKIGKGKSLDFDIDNF